MSTAIETLPIQFAGVRSKGRIPEWAKAWNVRSTTLGELQTTETEPGIVVIQSRAPAELVAQAQSLRSWTKARASRDLHIVISFPESHDRTAGELAEVLKLFRGTPQVDFANGLSHLKDSVTESAAKYLVYHGEPNEASLWEGPVPSRAPARSRRIARREGTATATAALGEAREVIAAVRPLLAPSGRLSAPKVAAVFGLSTAKLGRLIGGSSRQALAKTPDAPSIQDALRPFERIARLQAVLSESDFRAWLHRANSHLDDHTPMQVIETGRAAVVADLAESMLTGTPS